MLVIHTQMLLWLHGMQSFRPGLLHHTVAADSHMVIALTHALVLLNICTAQQAWSCCQAVTFVWYQAFEPGVWVPVFHLSMQAKTSKTVQTSVCLCICSAASWGRCTDMPCASTTGVHPP